MARIRTFVAVDISEEVRRGLAALISQLEPLASGIRWVRPESLHITLKFLGEVEETRLSELREALDLAVRGISAFDYALTGPGCFPSWRRPRVLWVGVHNADHQLFRLQKQVEEAFQQLGFDPEDREFTAHLTVARVKSPGGAAAVLERFRKAAIQVAPVHVSEVRLMQSHLRPDGAVYSVLHRVPLPEGK
jgi:2'-5' RNA ligase